MLTIPMVVNEQCYDLFIILLDDNVDRIKSYDPAEVVTANLSGPFVNRHVRTVVIMYANEKDVQEVMALCRAGTPNKALKYLSRGFQFRPEKGDSDVTDGYPSIL